MDHFAEVGSLIGHQVIPRTAPTLAPGMTLQPATASKPYAILLLHNEPVNSFTLAFYRSLHALLTDYFPFTSPPTRGLIIASSLRGRNLFSAGNDLRSFFPPLTNRQEFREYWNAFQRGIFAVYSSPLLTLAAVRGFSGAAGTGLMLSCDYKLGTEDSLIGLNEVRIGVPVPPVWCELWAENVTGAASRARAERMLMLGEMVDGRQAKELGLLDELLPATQAKSEPAQQAQALLEAAEKRMHDLLSRVADPGRVETKAFCRARLSAKWQQEISNDDMADRYYDFFSSDVSRTAVGKILRLDKDGRPLQKL